MDADATTHVFLSGVRARTHLVYAASYLRHLLASGQSHVALFVLDAGGGFGHARLGPDDVRQLLPDDTRLDIVTDLPEDLWPKGARGHRILLSVGAPGLRAFSGLLLGAWGVPPHVVVVDEGIGSYGTWRTRRAAYRRQGGGLVWPLVRAVAVATGNRVLTRTRWSLYERRHGRWAVNEEIAQEFRARISGPAADPASAVYLGQPWPELGIMSEAAYAAHLQEVRLACQRAGLAFVVRPHPSEPPGRYTGDKMTVTTSPAELDRAVVEAPVVIGTQSTALLNLASIHGSRAVRLAVPQLSGLDAALGRRQRELLDAFLPEPVSPEHLPATLMAVLRRPDPSS